MNRRPSDVARLRPCSPLGVALTRFVGRGDVLERMIQSVERNDRLITLTGPPGSGKTRVAERFAELHGDRWEEVLVLDLARATSRSELRVVLMDALAVGPSRAASIVDVLAARGRLLIVLDNFEQLGTEAAAEVAEWCVHAPQLTCVITSRIRTDVVGEVVVEVQALPLADAVSLLEDRVTAAAGRADRAFLPAELEALARALDGIPLAIELAAAHARVLSISDILARLERSRFALLSRPARRPDDRHACLESVLAASWNVLSGAEQSALASCSIFASSFSLAAAEAIIEGAFPLIEALCDRSWIATERVRGGDTIRFRLLVSVRTFALERLVESKRDKEMARRHRAFFVDEAESMLDRLRRTGDADARRWLAQEKEDLALVVCRLLGRTDPLSIDEARALASAALARDTVMLAQALPDRSAALDAVIDGVANVGIDAALLARLYVARGRLFGTRGLEAAAIADFETAIEHARRAETPSVEAESRLLLGVRKRLQGLLDDALDLTKIALSLAEGTDHPRLEAEALACLGLLEVELDRGDVARHTNERALAAFRRFKNRASEGLALGNLAQLAQARGDQEEAACSYEAALDAFRSTDDVAYEGMYLGLYAGLLHERGDLFGAKELYEKSLERLAYADAQHIRALIIGAAAAVDAGLDDIEAAERGFSEAMPTDAPGFAAAVELHRGHLDLARARRDGDDAHVFAARRRLAAIGPKPSSSAVRCAQRLLEAALDRFDARRPALRIAADGAWFEVRGAELVDLARRGPMRRVLRALVQRHGADSGALDRDGAFEAGWPGEQAQAEAASTRVRVAIATLRKLGLDGIIITNADGYLIDPALEIEIDNDVQSASIVSLKTLPPIA